MDEFPLENGRDSRAVPIDRVVPRLESTVAPSNQRQYAVDLLQIVQFHHL
jgi:hypothetical protein